MSFYKRDKFLSLASEHAIQDLLLHFKPFFMSFYKRDKFLSLASQHAIQDLLLHFFVSIERIFAFLMKQLVKLLLHNLSRQHIKNIGSRPSKFFSPFSEVLVVFRLVCEVMHIIIMHSSSMQEQVKIWRNCAINLWVNLI